MKILISGGGTGGHLYPALAVAEALKGLQKDVEILFVGSARGIESREVPEAGMPFRALETVGFPRRFSLKAARAAWSFGRAVIEARAIVREFAPHVVFSTGGYVSAPVVVAARLERVPVVLQEQNSVPGLTNRVACRMASEVHVAFASARRFFPKRGHLRLTGNPLRAQVLSGSRARALRLFRLDDDRTTILVFGGSQGARSLNDAIAAALPHFAGREDVQFLLQSGTDDYDRLLAKCRDVPVKTWVRRFITNMGDAYALADLVVCRAGAMTLAELAAAGLPSILVPYPHATGNHQWLNAEQMQEAGAALIIPNEDLTGPRLAEEIEALLAERKAMRQMAVSALRMARPDAAVKLGRALLKFRPASEAEPEPIAGPQGAQRGRGPRPGPSGRAGGSRPTGGRGHGGQSAGSGGGHRGGPGGGQGGGSGGGPGVGQGGRSSAAGGRSRQGETAASSVGPGVQDGNRGTRRQRRQNVARPPAGANGERGGP